MVSLTRQNTGLPVRQGLCELPKSMAARAQDYVSLRGHMTTNTVEGFNGLARDKRTDLGHTHYDKYVTGSENRDHFALNAFYAAFLNCHHTMASRAPGFPLGL